MGRLPKRGRKRRERIDESKNVQTTPTRTYCKRSRPLPYCNPSCRTNLVEYVSLKSVSRNRIHWCVRCNRYSGRCSFLIVEWGKQFSYQFKMPTLLNILTRAGLKYESLMRTVYSECYLFGVGGEMRDVASSFSSLRIVI